MGRVINSRPSVEDLEDEKFDRSFEVIFATKEGLESVRRALLTIAEVHEVEVLRVDGTEAPVEAEAEGGIVEEELEKDEAVDDRAQEAAGMSAAPVRTQSVRVNISRLDNLMNLVGELVINRTRLQEIASSQNISGAQGSPGPDGPLDRGSAGRGDENPHGAGGAYIQPLPAHGAGPGQEPGEGSRLRDRGQGHRAGPYYPGRDKRPPDALAAQCGGPWHRQPGGAGGQGKAAARQHQAHGTA